MSVIPTLTFSPDGVLYESVMLLLFIPLILYFSITITFFTVEWSELLK